MRRRTRYAGHLLAQRRAVAFRARIVSSDMGLAWTIWSDVLWITSPTKAETNELMVVKIYDVSDLVVETRDRPYRGNGLPTVEADEPRAPVSNYKPPATTPGGMMGGMGGMSGGTMSGGTMGGGTMGGGMGGGIFSVPPEASAATISASGSATLRTVTCCIPVVGSGERSTPWAALFPSRQISAK